VNTVLVDDPSLTIRHPASGIRHRSTKPLRRIILDSHARTPTNAKVVSDGLAALTTVVVSESAAKRRVAALAKQVAVVTAPVRTNRIDLPWLLEFLGDQSVTSLLVEGGGKVNGSFLEQRLAHRLAFFYAPKILGGAASLKGVAGEGATDRDGIPSLREVAWRRFGPDLFMTARCD
jgi:diaminohydroxyphosphoribosylaminopyrimidine deaminase / 5-amino-6-(5-phosphoribosylamino)uracil reductase